MFETGPENLTQAFFTDLHITVPLTPDPPMAFTVPTTGLPFTSSRSISPSPHRPLPSIEETFEYIDDDNPIPPSQQHPEAQNVTRKRDAFLNMLAWLRGDQQGEEEEIDHDLIIPDQDQDQPDEPGIYYYETKDTCCIHSC